jgi:hypothetical protein
MNQEALHWSLELDLYDPKDPAKSKKQDTDLLAKLLAQLMIDASPN